MVAPEPHLIETAPCGGTIHPVSPSSPSPADPPLGRSPCFGITRNADPTVVVEMVGGDLRVRTRTVQSKPPKSPGGRPRPASAVFGKDARRRLRNAVRGLLDPWAFVTLTFPDQVAVDDAHLRRCWDRLRRWLLARGASGVVALEFCGSGRPHLHAVVDVPVRTLDLAREWARILGLPAPAASQHMVWVTHVTSQRRLADYMAKPAQKSAPEGFSVGRWWSSFGPKKPSKPRLVLQGPRSALADVLARLWGQRPQGRPPRTASGDLPPRFWVAGGVDANWAMLVGLGIVT